MKPAADAAPSPIRRLSKNRGARLNLRMLLLLALILAFALRCGDAPTQPNIRATPTPGPLDLNGEWSGTFVGGLCATPEEISIRLSHVEDRIHGFFNMSCLETFSSAVELDGTVSGSYPYVWLNVNDQHACLLSGVAVTSTSITLRSRSATQCHGSRLSLTR